MKRHLLFFLTLVASTPYHQLYGADLVATPDTTHDEYAEAVNALLLFAATQEPTVAHGWREILTPLIRHLCDTDTYTLRAEPPLLNEHQLYDLSIALAWAEDDEATPTVVADSLLTLAGVCTAPPRGPRGNKPKPSAYTAVDDSVRNSRKTEQQRTTITGQRLAHNIKQERYKRRLANRAKRAAKHNQQQETLLANQLGGQELHDTRRERDLASGRLREEKKRARNTIRQNKKNKKDAVRTDQELKADNAKKRQEARKRRKKIR